MSLEPPKIWERQAKDYSLSALSLAAIHQVSLKLHHNMRTGSIAEGSTVAWLTVLLGHLFMSSPAQVDVHNNVLDNELHLLRVGVDGQHQGLQLTPLHGLQKGTTRVSLKQLTPILTSALQSRCVLNSHWGWGGLSPSTRRILSSAPSARAQVLGSRAADAYR